MPRVIESNAARYGIIGITFALLTWLIVVGFCVVVVAVISVEVGGAAEGDRRPVAPDRHDAASEPPDPARGGGPVGEDPGPPAPGPDS
jgi:membrane protein